MWCISVGSMIVMLCCLLLRCTVSVGGGNGCFIAVSFLPEKCDSPFESSLSEAPLRLL
jgi:hypothetical protein